ncbi:MAG TPA: DNA-formamidopyrimidine glycosylase family protein, partial [Pseudonocardiaceae bacterium]|nr:DNA-formamidopyrimidine glycosylase family protein [Pseudonocardiaceae bacterium]
MPELPEVEVVRRGLADHVVGRTVTTVQVRHPRSVRRHLAGDLDFAARLTGRTIQAARRRGKYLWLELGVDEALLAHLGMSGQMRVQPADAPDEAHLRVRFGFTDSGPQLRFIDQRTFGGLSVEELVEGLPAPVAHIARDPMDPDFDPEAVVEAMRRRRTGLKRALLDQTLVSGIGNIYADEA